MPFCLVNSNLIIRIPVEEKERYVLEALDLCCIKYDFRVSLGVYLLHMHHTCDDDTLKVVDCLGY